MSENELREYIRTHYPKENETNEWKEFKNLKNDFNGKEKNDIISYVSGIANMDGGNLGFWHGKILLNTPKGSEQISSEPFGAIKYNVSKPS